MKGLRGDQLRQIAAHRADRLCNRHVIVVQDHNEPRIRRAGIVHALKGHAGAHRAIANHRNDIARHPLKVAPHRHAKAGGN